MTPEEASIYTLAGKTHIIANEAMVWNPSERAPLCGPIYTLTPKILEWLRFKFLDNLGECEIRGGIRYPTLLIGIESHLRIVRQYHQGQIVTTRDVLSESSVEFTAYDDIVHELCQMPRFDFVNAQWVQRHPGTLEYRNAAYEDVCMKDPDPARRMVLRFCRVTGFRAPSDIWAEVEQERAAKALRQL